MEHFRGAVRHLSNISSSTELDRNHGISITQIRTIKGHWHAKIFISVKETVPWVRTNGDTKSCYTYAQIGKNPQLPVAVLPRVSHFHDDVTRGAVRHVNVLQMRIAAILVLYSGSETWAYRASTMAKHWWFPQENPLNPRISPPCSHCLQLRVPRSFSTSSTLPFSAIKSFHVSDPLVPWDSSSIFTYEVCVISVDTWTSGNLIGQNYSGWREPSNWPKDNRTPFRGHFVSRSGGMRTRLEFDNQHTLQICCCGTISQSHTLHELVEGVRSIVG